MDNQTVDKEKSFKIIWRPQLYFPKPLEEIGKLSDFILSVFPKPRIYIWYNQVQWGWILFPRIDGLDGKFIESKRTGMWGWFKEDDIPSVVDKFFEAIVEEGQLVITDRWEKKKYVLKFEKESWELKAEGIFDLRDAVKSPIEK